MIISLKQNTILNRAQQVTLLVLCWCCIEYLEKGVSEVSGAGGVSNFIGATASWTFLDGAHRCLDRDRGFPLLGCQVIPPESAGKGSRSKFVNPINSTFTTPCLDPIKATLCHYPLKGCTFLSMASLGEISFKHLLMMKSKGQCLQRLVGNSHLSRKNQRQQRLGEGKQQEISRRRGKFWREKEIWRCV